MKQLWQQFTYYCIRIQEAFENLPAVKDKERAPALTTKASFRRN